MHLIPASDFLYEHENEHHLAYYSAIGRFIVVWSNLELLLDLNLMTIYDNLGGKRFIDEPPVALGRKLDLWGKCFKNIEKLNNLKNDAIYIRKSINELRFIRNDLLHSHWPTLFNIDHPQDISGVSIKSDNCRYHLSGKKFSLDNIYSLTEETSKLIQPLTQISLQISFLNCQ